MLAALVLGLLSAVATAGMTHANACRDDAVYLRGEWGSARFSVDVVDTVQTRSRGLMFVEYMPRSKGMLFVYQQPTFVSFWMKNTLIPLDMIFLDQRGVVRKVHHNAIPGDLTHIPGGRDILVVLEINGGLARQMGITVGSEMRHSAFGKDAAWACD